MSEHIRVIARVRPFTENEKSNHHENVVFIEEKRYLRLKSDESLSGTKDFQFDKVFDTDSSQIDLFDEVIPLLVSSFLS